MPAIYLGHGAPPLLEDELWMSELTSWARSLPRPDSILIVSAHWERAPATLSATHRVGLVYDFYGFPQHFYDMKYDAPGAPNLAAQVKALLSPRESVTDHATRGLDHGAWVPLKVMYPDADIPVLQLSMPDLDPQHLFDIGRRLAPLRDEGVLVIGSGFLTHGLPFVREYMLGKPGAPAVVRRLRSLGQGGTGPWRPRRALRVPREGPRYAVRPPHRRALRSALRDSRRRLPARWTAGLRHRRVRLGALEAFVRGALKSPRCLLRAPRRRSLRQPSRRPPRSPTKDADGAASPHLICQTQASLVDSSGSTDDRLEGLHPGGRGRYPCV